MSRTVLVVDDEPSIRKVLSQYLVSEGHRVLEAATGAEALQHLGLLGGQGSGVDLVLLDLGLPDIDGLEVLSTIRRSQTVYVMVLTARAEEVDKLVGLNVGADDYVTKPFSVEELVARIRAILRRTMGAQKDGSRLTFADLELDEDTHEVLRGGKTVDLTPTEFKLLHYMMLNPRRVLTKTQIMDRVWDYDFGGRANVVETYISYLRKKIDVVDPPLIHTVRGVGYSLRLPRE